MGYELVHVGPDLTQQAELLGNTKHPATNSLTLVAKLIHELTGPGAMIVDPMAGTGSTGMLAAREGRHALCMDCEPELVAWGTKRWEELNRQTSLTPPGAFEFKVHDAREPWGDDEFADAVIFSPPFLDQLPSDARPSTQWDPMLGSDRSYEGTKDNLGRTYGDAACNLGHFKDLDEWGLSMHHILLNAKQALRREGRIAVIMRDLMRNGRLVPLTWHVSRYLELLGLQLQVGWKRELTHLSMWTRMRENRGEEVIKTEYVIIGRKP
jgi:hypothetical protein